VAWIVCGVVGWGGLGWIAIQLDAASSSQVGFDLDLLLDGARAIAGGRSPYDPAMLSGAAPAAPSLFYSYPPLVAQALVPLAQVPNRVMLLLWDCAAVIGLLAVAEAMRRTYAPALARRFVLVPVLASVPLILPFAVGLLFGNLDVFFPLFYGAMLLAATATPMAGRLAGGVALAAASVKLHPASLVLWFGARTARADGTRQLLTIPVVGLIAGVAAVGVSVTVWGVDAWLDFARVVRAGTGAELVDVRNAGIAAQLALVVGGGEGLARAGHLVVGLGAVVLTVWAAWRRADPVESFAWATAASLSTLPVTWYHYPSALIPVAIAAVLRAAPGGAARSTRWLVLAAGVVGGVAIAWLPLLWVAVGLIVAAARVSGRTRRTGA
jgi:hypothetical protein